MALAFVFSREPERSGSSAAYSPFPKVCMFSATLCPSHLVMQATCNTSICASRHANLTLGLRRSRAALLWACCAVGNANWFHLAEEWTTSHGREKKLLRDPGGAENTEATRSQRMGMARRFGKEGKTEDSFIVPLILSL